MNGPMFLAAGKAAKVHEATLSVLETTGISLDHPEAEELFLQAGAKKAPDGRILIPRALVEETLEKAGNGFKLYHRDGSRYLDIEVGQTYFGTGSDALYNVDLQTGDIRRSLLDDLRNNVTIDDRLEGFDFIMSMALPSDVEPQQLYTTVFSEMAAGTVKPMVVTSTSLEDVQGIHAQAAALKGGEEQLRQEPFFVAYLEPISPLIMDHSSAERLLYCAKHGIPFMYAAGANCGSGAPVTPEGGLVQGSAESLSGLVLGLLKNENALFIYGSNTSSLDMRTGLVAYGAPEWFRTVSMYADMGMHYNLPIWGTAGSSDSLSVDAQAGMEAYEGIMMALLSGPTMVHDMGYLAHGEIYDARMLVLTDMMITRARKLLREADLSDGSLAVDTINEVARGERMYLAHKHTATRFRKALWLPPAYIDRRHVEKGRRDLEEMLSDEVKKLLTGAGK